METSDCNIQYPCPCGYHGDSQHRCSCSMHEIQRYRQRLSGPLLDRIDMTLEVARLPVEKLVREENSAVGADLVSARAGDGGFGHAETSSQIKVRVMRAREIQLERNHPLPGRSAGMLPADSVGAAHVPPASISPADVGAKPGFALDGGLATANPDGSLFTDTPALGPEAGGTCAAPTPSGAGGSPVIPLPHPTPPRGVVNAALTSRQVRQYCRLSEACQALLTRAVERLGLSARAYERIRKVARTIADLDGAADIEVPHLAEAIQYRSGEERMRG